MLAVLGTPKIQVAPRDGWEPVQACCYFPWIVLSLKSENLNFPLENRFKKHTDSSALCTVTPEELRLY